MFSLYSDCLEKTEIRADVQQLPLASHSIMTTAVLNYIDYERKKLLANQGRFFSKLQFVSFIEQFYSLTWLKFFVS